MMTVIQRDRGVLVQRIFCSGQAWWSNRELPLLKDDVKRHRIFWFISTCIVLNDSVTKDLALRTHFMSSKWSANEAC